MKNTKIIAFHLPQFYPTLENDQWWGAGFTEWRNVAKARPLFPGHRQPNLPGELGFYDLRLEEVREQQAELAVWAGISGFCYYHYWFAGRRFLEKPVEWILARGAPSFPFCLCWANEHLTNHWKGHSNQILVEQTYPGHADHRQHYEYLRKFFQDKRYLTIGNKPVMAIFRPKAIPEVALFVDLFQKWAMEDGFKGIFLIGLDSDPGLLKVGFDALAPHSLNLALESYLKENRHLIQYVRHKVLKYPRWVIDYSALDPFFKNHECDGVTYLPTVIPNWDNTPRIAQRGLVLNGSSPDKFKVHLQRSVSGLKVSEGGSERIVFIKSWNEWAEGNYLEPDLFWGRKWLEVVKNLNL